MNNKILHIDIGNPDNDVLDFLKTWESGEVANPLYKLTFESMGGFLKALTPKRWEMLTTLRMQGSQSIYQLAKSLKRDYKNIYTDVYKLLELGLLEKDPSGSVFVPWDEIETHLKLAA